MVTRRAFQLGGLSMAGLAVLGARLPVHALANRVLMPKPSLYVMTYVRTYTVLNLFQSVTTSWLATQPKADVRLPLATNRVRKLYLLDLKSDAEMTCVL